MTGVIATIPKFQFSGATGIPLASGTLTAYLAGTTTPVTTYQDQALTIANTNPIVLDSRGECILWLDSTKNYKFVLKNSAGVTQWTQDNLTNPLGLLSSSIGSNLITYLPAGTGAVSRTVQSKLRESVSVLDFGADPTGVLDSSDAFNLATQATIPWHVGLRYNIEVPAGTYKISKRIYVRKGQTLHGSGHGSYIDCTALISTVFNAFILGSGLISGAIVQDAGGEAVKIDNLNTLGGSGSHSVVWTDAAGYSITNMFMTGPGIGITAGGADGLISNIEIDQCLNGIVFQDCQNIALNNFNIYLPNYAMLFSGTCQDIAISNGVIEYTKYASVYFSDGSTSQQAILFSNVDFFLNAQFSTFSGFVYSRASSVAAQFSNCSFRNMYHYAISQDAGVDCKLTFTGCVFDGNKTNPAYNQSTTAKVISTGYGSYIFTGCEFRNLLGEIAKVNSNITLIKIHGGRVVNIPRTRLNIVATDTPLISIKDVADFALAEVDGTNQMIVLPYWGMSAGWKVTVKGNTVTGSNANYLASESALYSVMWQFDGTSNLYADKTLIWKSPGRVIPSDLGAVVCFGVVPAGAVSSATYTSTGTICISVPTSVASSFSWDVETVI